MTITTTSKLAKQLNKERGCKITGEPFTQSDISNYVRRGYIPWRYGGDMLKRGSKRGEIIVTKREF